MSLLALMMKENSRLMDAGYPHMSIEEMRFIVGGICGPSGLRELERIISDIRALKSE